MKQGIFNNACRITACLISALLIPVRGSALYDQSDGVELYTPEQIVEKYCRADLDGATLSTTNYEKSGIAKIIIPGEFEGPAWDYAIVTKAFHVGSTKITDNLNVAEVTVVYDEIGGLGVGFGVKKKEELYVFKLRKTDGTWKLSNPYDLPPHISVKSAIRHLEHLIEIQGETSNERETIKELREY